MRSSPLGALVLAGAIALHAAPGGVAAQPRPGVAAASKADRRALKKARKLSKRYEKKGTKAYAKRRWDDAIVAFELAHQADPRPRYLFNIGRCLEQKGDLFKAMEYVRAYVDTVADDTEREDATEVYNILRGKLLRTRGEVSLRSEPNGATVTLQSEEGARRKGGTPYLDWLEAGTWTVRVALDGHEALEDQVVVGVGGSVERLFELKPPAPEAPPRKPKPKPKLAKADDLVPTSGPDGRAVAGEEPADAPSGGSGVAAWLTLGAGGLLLAGGTTFGVLAGQAAADLERYRDEPGTATRAQAEAAREASERDALLANVLLGAGVVAAGAGVALLLLGGDEETAHAGLLPVPGGGLVTVVGEL